MLSHLPTNHNHNFPLLLLLLALLLSLLNLLPITLAKQSTAQVAEHYGAEVLSLTDAAQMIEFLSQEFNAENEHQVNKLMRKAFWACGAERMRSSQAEEATPPSNEATSKKAATPQAPRLRYNWQLDFSSRICKNFYMMIALIDIELMMFQTKLEIKAKEKYWFPFFHKKEQKIEEDTRLNFILSRLYAFGQILTINFLKLASEDGKLAKWKGNGMELDKPHYLEKLRFFEQQTEFLLGWIKSNDKFKMAEKGGFWAWLKNTQKHVKVDFMQKIQDFKEKPNEHDETFHCAEEVEMFSKIYDKMQTDVQDLDQVRENEEERQKKPFFLRIISKHEDEDVGFNNLYNQPPWCLYRVHEKAKLFAQVALLDAKKANEEEDKLNNQQKVLHQRLQQEHNKNGNTNVKGNQPTIPPLPETESSEMLTFWRMIDNTNQVETGNINKIELPRQEAIHLLKLFDSDDFMRIKENTGKGAIRQFFVKGYKGLVNYQVSEGTCETITKTIVEKFEAALHVLDMALLRQTGVEVPIGFDQVILSYREQNVFGLCLLNKFAIFLATKMLPKKEQEEIKDPKEKHLFVKLWEVVNFVKIGQKKTESHEETSTNGEEEIGIGKLVGNPHAKRGKGNNFLKSAANFLFRHLRRKTLNWKAPKKVLEYFKQKQKELERTEEYEKLQKVLQAIEQEQEDGDDADGGAVKKHDLGTVHFEKYFEVHDEKPAVHGHGPTAQVGKGTGRQGSNRNNSNWKRVNGM